MEKQSLEEVPPGPYLEVTFSTSSAVYDFSSTDGPFEIYMQVKLCGSTWPITVYTFESVFDQSKALKEEGLSFADVATNKNVPRDFVQVCYMGTYNKYPMLAEKYWLVEFRPGVPQVWTYALPTASHQKATPHLTQSAISGFKNHQTYRLGVSEQPKLWWYWGPKWIVLLKAWWTRARITSEDSASLPISVRETADFTPKNLSKSTR